MDKSIGIATCKMEVKMKTANTDECPISIERVLQLGKAEK